MTEADQNPPLSGYRVLDLGSALSFHCTRLLADMGADVIKIEPPSGDPARRVPPFKDDFPHPEKSLYFLHFNTNKRGITLDVEKPDGRAILFELCRTADVVVETYSPARCAELGLSYERLSANNPALVVASITPFGQSGPWRDRRGRATASPRGASEAAGAPRAPSRSGARRERPPRGAPRLQKVAGGKRPKCPKCPQPAFLAQYRRFCPNAATFDRMRAA